MVKARPRPTTKLPPRPGRTRRNAPAAETRAALLAVGSSAFARAGFEQVGLRDLAAAAGTDPAIILRLFGSKEALFAQIVAGAFAAEPPVGGPLAGLGPRIAAFLLDNPRDQPAANALALLMHSATSPTAAPILSRALHARFVAPLAEHLGGREAPLRAALLAAGVLGFATLHRALGSEPLARAPRARVVAQLGAMLQACIA